MIKVTTYSKKGNVQGVVTGLQDLILSKVFASEMRSWLEKKLNIQNIEGIRNVLIDWVLNKEDLISLFEITEDEYIVILTQIQYVWYKARHCTYLNQYVYVESVDYLEETL